VPTAVYTSAATPTATRSGAPDNWSAALAALAEHSTAQNIELIDCQLASAHLRSLGSRPMRRREFLSYLQPH
jgi:Leu/Phe-tRNA-protein transferase